jgi:aldehyde dehydrogenase (NAD+)
VVDGASGILLRIRGNEGRGGPVGVPGAARDAIAAAKAAFALYSKSTLDERLGYLRQIQDAIARRSDVAAIMIEEYGAAPQIAAFSVEWAIKSYRNAAKLLDDVPFTRSYGTAQVSLKPVGVAGLITPWNANVLIISQKLAPALAAGRTVVISPASSSSKHTRKK